MKPWARLQKKKKKKSQKKRFLVWEADLDRAKKEGEQKGEKDEREGGRE